MISGRIPGRLAVGCQPMSRNGQPRGSPTRRHQRKQPPATAGRRAPQRPVAVFALDFEQGASTGGHAHPFGQLVYGSSGVMRVTTDGGSWVVPPRRAVWVPPNLEHDVAMVTSVAMRTVYVLPAALPVAPKHACVVEVAPLLRELILQALRLPRPYPLGGAEERLFGVLLDQISFHDVVPLHLPEPSDARTRRIAAALAADPGSKRTLAGWSRGSGGSARTLARAFVRETGLTFGAYRAQLRLMRALELLALGRSVTAVALTLGYNSVSAFVTKFRRHLGTTPARYYAIDGGDGPQRASRTSSGV